MATEHAEKAADLGPQHTIFESGGGLAKRIHIYRNGDRYFRGLDVVVTPKRYRTFDALLADLSVAVDLPTGAVRHIYTPVNGHRVNHLSGFKTGQKYVCAGPEKLRKMDYSKISLAKWVPYVKKIFGEDLNSSKNDPPNPKFSPPKLDRFRKAQLAPITRQPNATFFRPRVINIYRNGDPVGAAAKVLLNKKTALSFEQVLQDVSEAVKLDNGAVHRIYTLDGERVHDLSYLINESNPSDYVAGGREAFRKLRYGAAGALRTIEGSNNSSTNNSGKEHPNTTGSRKPPGRLEPIEKKKKEKRDDGIDSHADRLLQESEQAEKAASEERHRQREAGKSKIEKRQHTIRQADDILESHGAHRDKMESEKERQMRAMKEKIDIRKSFISSGDEGSARKRRRLEDEYDVGEQIGEGNFAIVSSCTNKKTHKKFAVKAIDKAKCKGKEKLLETELEILKRVNHPNIVGLVDDFDTSKYLYLVMELVTGGDLFDVLIERSAFTEKDAAKIILAVVEAVAYLHKEGIVHRDLKPENLLVAEDPSGNHTIKIGDFGLAKIIPPGTMLHTVCGTPSYVAPEILSDAGYGKEVDIWAIGVITYILLSGYPPFSGATQNELFENIKRGVYHFDYPVWDSVSDDAKDFIRRLLSMDPLDRPTAGELLSDSWLTGRTAYDTDIHAMVKEELIRNFNPRRKFRAAVRLMGAAKALLAYNSGQHTNTGELRIPAALHNTLPGTFGGFNNSSSGASPSKVVSPQMRQPTVHGGTFDAGKKRQETIRKDDDGSEEEEEEEDDDGDDNEEEEPVAAARAHVQRQHTLRKDADDSDADDDAGAFVGGRGKVVATPPGKPASPAAKKGKEEDDDEEDEEEEDGEEEEEEEEGEDDEDEEEEEEEGEDGEEEEGEDDEDEDDEEEDDEDEKAK